MPVRCRRVPAAEATVTRRLSATLLAVALVGVLSSMGMTFAPHSAECDEPEARQFDFWIGQWNIRQKILREGAGYLELPAKTRVSRTLDGCALVEHWEGEVQFFWEGMARPEPMKGLSVRAYDPRTRQWIIHWMDTRSRRFDQPYVGSFSDGKGEFYREWQEGGAARVGRITFSRSAEDTVSWTLDISSDQRQTWTTVWSMDMHRETE